MEEEVTVVVMVVGGATETHLLTLSREQVAIHHTPRDPVKVGVSSGCVPVLKFCQILLISIL